MTNKAGTTFKEGVWYSCNFKNTFFKYLKDYTTSHTNPGVYYTEWVFNGVYAIRENYINNSDYLDKATEAKWEELAIHLPASHSLFPFSS